MSRFFLFILHTGGLLLCLCLPAQAASLSCGVYSATEGNGQLHINRVGEAIEFSHAGPPRPLAYQVTGDQLQVHDLEQGFSQSWTLAQNGQRVTTGLGQSYTLKKAASCQPPAVIPAGSCRADLAECFNARYQADETTLTRWCEQENLPFACGLLIDQFQDMADEQAQAAAGRSTPSPELALAIALQRLSSDEAALAPMHLDRSLALCQRSSSATVCDKAAKKLWAAHHYLQARDALNIACQRGQSPSACAQAAPLATLTAADLHPSPTPHLPCGHYTSPHGMISSLRFGDAGLVEIEAANTLRARLENGFIRIRHDKGGDFVFKPLGGNRLLGQDQWSRYLVYQPDDSTPQSCTPPRPFREQALTQDCPVMDGPDAAQACCQAGKLQGCQVQGHRRVLAGDWNGAQPYYLKICTASVRTGCENLLQVYVHTGAASIITAMQALCKNDAMHVACDLLGTSDWEQMRRNRELLDGL